MGTIEKVIGIMLMLIALYLVLANSGAFNAIMKGLGTFNLATIGALQGRVVDAYGIKLGGNSIGVGTGGPSQFGGALGFGGISGIR